MSDIGQLEKYLRTLIIIIQATTKGGKVMSESINMAEHDNHNEEFWNVITHGVGFLLSIPALFLLMHKANLVSSSIYMASFIVFGLTMMILYLSSTLFHGFKKYKHIFSKLDHFSIYLFIAGTYTPIALIGVGGKLGITICLIEWILTCIGIVCKCFFIYRYKKLSLLFYISMGWLVVIAINPLVAHITLTGFLILLAGGIFYTVGAYFYQNNKIPYNHAIWHLFVLAGSASMYWCIIDYL